MRRFLKIQTPGFILLLVCPKSPELLVAALQGSQGFSPFLQGYRGIVPAGRDSLGCKEAPASPPSGWISQTGASSHCRSSRTPLGARGKQGNNFLLKPGKSKVSYRSVAGGCGNPETEGTAPAQPRRSPCPCGLGTLSGPCEVEGEPATCCRWTVPLPRGREPACWWSPSSLCPVEVGAGAPGAPQPRERQLLLPGGGE